VNAESIRQLFEQVRERKLSPDEAVQDGKIVTGKTWQSHPEFYRLVFNCLQTQTAAVFS